MPTERVGGGGRRRRSGEKVVGKHFGLALDEFNLRGSNEELITGAGGRWTRRSESSGGNNVYGLD